MWNLILPHGKYCYSIINKTQDLTKSYNIYRKNIPLCKLAWAPIIWETLLAGWAKTNLVIRENEWNSHCIYFVQCKSRRQNNLEGRLRKVFWLFHFNHLQELKKVTSIMFFFFLQMEPLQACMVTIILATVLKTAESCSGSKDFTFYDLKNPDAQQTCKRCQTCPPGQGLVKQCGSKVPYGTFTGCKPCVYNETYSEKKDTSHCKPCNRCGLRTVLQRCTPWQNSRCAATCRSGYIMDPVVDECKVVPENKTAASPLTSRNSTDEPSGMIASSDTKSPGTTSPTVSTYGITATNSTPANSSIRVRSTPLEDNQSTGQDSKNFKKTKIIVGSTCGAVFTILAAYFGIRKCRRKLNIHNFEHHDKSGNNYGFKGSFK